MHVIIKYPMSWDHKFKAGMQSHTCPPPPVLQMSKHHRTQNLRAGKDFKSH